MSKLFASFGVVALSAVVLLYVASGTTQVAGGPPTIPPPGTDEMEINGRVVIDLFQQGPENIPVEGNLAWERGQATKDPATGDTVIPIEIVALNLSGDSNLLGPNTPVIVSLNENAPASTGEITQVDSFFDVFFDLEFLDVQIGDFGHFLMDPTHVTGTKMSIPPTDEKFGSGDIQNPIQDNQDPDRTVGFLNELNMSTKPPPEGFSITVLKLEEGTGEPLDGFGFNLYGGFGCNPVNALDFGVSGDDGPGLVDFVGLSQGTYSVEEKPEADWNVVGEECQDVFVPGGPAGAAGDEFATCPIQNNDFPASGCDAFSSGAQVNIEINATGETAAITLNGPTTIVRGPVGDTDTDGFDDVDTEIIQLDLEGTHPTFGDVIVSQSSVVPSLGSFEEQDNVNPGVIDFPADSFFDVFFEVDLPDLGLTLHNEEPFHIECKIEEIPPLLCLYQPPVEDPIPLLDDNGNKIATLVHAAHVPLPDGEELVVFRNEPKDGMTPTPTPPDGFSITVLKLDDDTNEPLDGFEFNLYSGAGCQPAGFLDFGFSGDAGPGLLDFVGLEPGTYSVGEKPLVGWNVVNGACQDVDLAGASTGGFIACPIADNPFPGAGCDAFDSGAQVNIEMGGDTTPITLNGPTTVQRGPAADDDGNGLQEVETEILQLDLVGNHPGLGEVIVQQSTVDPSLGSFEEQESGTQEEFNFPADSFFDIFVEVDLPDLGLTLHNGDPLRMECKIESIPPTFCLYQPPVPDPIPLLDQNGQETGVSIVHAAHVPLPDNEKLVVFRNQRKEGDFSITILKLDDETDEPLDGFTFSLYQGPGCSIVNGLIDQATSGEAGPGLVDFTGLAPGTYSVGEEPLAGWNVVGEECQDVQVGAVGGSPASDLTCPIADNPLPGAGCDAFDSGAQVNIQMGSDTSTVTLNGPTLIERGPVGDDDENGKDEVLTEILKLSLNGTHPALGPVQVSQSTTLPSFGFFEEQVNETQGTIDFPADSLFGVFFDVQLPDAGLTLHNEDPLLLQCKIETIPPLLCLYQPPIDQPVELFDDDGNFVATIVHAVHVPLPDGEVLVVFRNEEKDETPTPTVSRTLTPTATPTATATRQPRTGDANGDGVTNAIDAAVILQFGAGIIPSVQNPAAADVNGDGVINSIDASLVLQNVAGLISLPL